MCGPLPLRRDMESGGIRPDCGQCSATLGQLPGDIGQPAGDDPQFEVGRVGLVPLHVPAHGTDAEVAQQLFACGRVRSSPSQWYRVVRCITDDAGQVSGSEAIRPEPCSNRIHVYYRLRGEDFCGPRQRDSDMPPRRTGYRMRISVAPDGAIVVWMLQEDGVVMIQRDSDGRVTFGRGEYAIQLLIILSLIAFAFETLPDLSPSIRRALRAFEVVSVAVFTVEYIVRLGWSRPRRGYALSFFGLIDLAAIVPFYLSTGLDFRSVRAFRLLRLFRILKLARYSSAMRRFHLAFRIAREELILFGVTAMILLYLSAVGIYYFENPAQPEAFTSVFDSLWWAIATMTTVGYGDVYPVTVGGRIFTFFVLVVGLGIVAVPSGLVASALSKAREMEGRSNRVK